MADIERQHENTQQAPEPTPAPVSVSPPIQGERLPPVETERSIERSVSVEVYRGPLPSPQDYREYAAIIPNGAERLMRMAEKQQDHEHKREMKGEARATLGVVSAVFSVSVAVGLSGYGFYTGHSVEALGVFGVTLAAIVGVFVRGTATQQGQQIEPPPAKSDEE